MVREIKPVKAIIEEIVAEAEAIIAKLATKPLRVARG